MEYNNSFKDRFCGDCMAIGAEDKVPTIMERAGLL